MPIYQAEPDYYRLFPVWQACRAVVAGQREVHAAQECYLPPLSGQSKAEYESYVLRTPFFNATGRTVRALSSLLLRKPLQIKQKGLEGFLENCDGAGLPFSALARHIAEEVLIVGRCGVLLDYPAEEGSCVHMPQTALYTTEQILSVEYAPQKNEKCLSAVRLKEKVTFVDPEDPFSYQEKEQIRLLELYEGEYRVRLFQEGEDGWEERASLVPLWDGKPLPFVPFVLFSTKNMGGTIAPPPIEDLVYLNLAHYRSSADYFHGAHFIGLPTAVITGHDAAMEEELKIGSSQAWVFPEADAKVYYLEFQGKGLETLRMILEDLKEQMAVLGARFLASEKKGVETEGTTLLRQQWEGGTLSFLSSLLSEGLTAVLGITASWSRRIETVSLEPQQKVKVTVNRDFSPLGLSQGLLKELVLSWQAGAISLATLLDNLEQGELLPHSSEQEKERLEQETKMRSEQSGQPKNSQKMELDSSGEEQRGIYVTSSAK